MGLVSHTKRFIFIKTVKTASTTTQHLLLPHCMPEGLRLENPKTNFELVSNTGIVGKIAKDRSRNFFFHQTAAETRKLLARDQWNAYLKVCNIRNPFDQIVSHYHHGLREGQYPETTEFGEYVRRIKTRFEKRHRSNWQVLCIRGRPAMDFYIRYESLEDDLRKLGERLQIELSAAEAGHFHKSERKSDYREYYDDKLVDFVYRYWKREINYFGYEF